MLVIKGPRLDTCTLARAKKRATNDCIWGDASPDPGHVRVFPDKQSNQDQFIAGSWMSRKVVNTRDSRCPGVFLIEANANT